jgi:hypothetical protein
MHTLLHSGRLPALLAQEGPGFGLALLVAELFYKFGSFSLECLAFLATWYAISGVVGMIARAGAAGDRS